MKNFIFHKLTLRVGYIIGAYATAQMVSVLSQPTVQTALNGAGLHIQILDETKLKMWIAGLVMVIGEFVYERIHKKVILPKVAPKPEEIKADEPAKQ